MKVLFIHNTLPEYRLEFFKELSKQVELHIAVTDIQLANSVYGLSFKKDIPIGMILVNRPKDILGVMDSNEFNVVVFPPIDTIYQFVVAFFAYKKCLQKKIPFVYWSEKWEAPLGCQPFKKRIKNWLHMKMITFYAKKANLCVASGSKAREYLVTYGVDKQNIVYAYDSSTSPSCDENTSIREKYGFSQNSKIVLYLGRLIERKGVMNLINAFKFVKNQLPSACLLICGEGEMLKKCKDYVAETNLENVFFAGKIEPSNRSLYYQQSDLFVLPSYPFQGIIEAWGLTVNEALEQGTPVIATDSVGAAYDLANGRECVMVPSGDDIALGKAIVDMLIAEKPVEESKKLYSQFSVRQMASQFASALLKISN